jgi:hypothetical protein
MFKSRAGDQCKPVEGGMRVVLIAMAFALLTVPAAAQGMSTGIGEGGREMPDPNAAEKKQKAEALDKDYSTSLKSIPNQNQKPDPWGDVRGSQTTSGKKPPRQR